VPGRRVHGQSLGEERCIWQRTGLQCKLGDLRLKTGTPHDKPAQYGPRFFNGCKPDSGCKHSCQKQSYGVQLDGVYARFSCAPFGIKTSGSMWHILLAPLLGHWRGKGVKLICWVDDVAFIVDNTCLRSATCGGEKQCPECRECWQRALALEAEFEKDLRDLGFETNSKNIAPTTCDFFLGLGFNTRTRCFHICPTKATKFACSCADVLNAAHTTRKDVASLSGKLAWWSPALFHSMLLSRAMIGVTRGEETRDKWEEPIALPYAARKEIEYWRDNIESLASKQVPMVAPNTARMKEDWLERSYWGTLKTFKMSRSQMKACTWVKCSPPPDGLEVGANPALRVALLRAKEISGTTRQLCEEDYAALPEPLIHRGTRLRVGPTWLAPTGTPQFDCSRGCTRVGNVEKAPDGSSRRRPLRREEQSAQAPEDQAAPDLDHGVADFLMSTDAGPLLWGGVLRSKGGRKWVCSGPYPASEPSAADADEGQYKLNQPWREGYASLMCLESFAPLMPASSTVLHEGDCQCVVAAINKGTGKSAILHRLAVKIWKSVAKHALLVYSGWIPGTEIIHSGADAMSREAGLDWSGLELDRTKQAWQAVQRLLQANGWELTLDLFASEANAKCARFMSRHEQPKAECVDAFTAASWAVNACPCGTNHREVVLAFPPDKLSLPMWARLEAEGARGVAVVRRHTTAPWWPIMLKGKLGRFVDTTGAQLILPLGCEAQLTKDKCLENNYVVVAFDFKPPSPAPHTPPLLIPQAQCQHGCPDASAFRGRKTLPAAVKARSELELRILLAESTVKARAGELRGVNGN
jgi:hypothetical protein